MGPFKPPNLDDLRPGSTIEQPKVAFQTFEGLSGPRANSNHMQRICYGVCVCRCLIYLGTSNTTKSIKRRTTHKVSFWGGRPLDLRFRGPLKAKSFVRVRKIDPPGAPGRVFDLNCASCGHVRRCSPAPLQNKLNIYFFCHGKVPRPASHPTFPLLGT